LNLLCGEAIEKEMGDDEVVRVGGWLPLAGVFEVSLDAVRVRAGAAEQGIEHGGTGVDSVDLNGWVGAEQALSEASVTVAEDKGAAADAEIGQECAADSVEPGTEGQVFHPTIEGRKPIEVWREIHWKLRGRRIEFPLR
jgi:hypothetical protein